MERTLCEKQNIDQDRLCAQYHTMNLSISSALAVTRIGYISDSVLQHCVHSTTLCKQVMSLVKIIARKSSFLVLYAWLVFGLS
jgi:hypothetical protein